LNETENVDLTVVRETGNGMAGKRDPFKYDGKQLKPNCYEIQHTYQENLKKWTEVPEWKICSPVGPFVGRNNFLSPPIRKNLIFQTISDCGRYNCQKKLHIALN
jgi:hypothetical protein